MLARCCGVRSAETKPSQGGENDVGLVGMVQRRGIYNEAKRSSMLP